MGVYAHIAKEYHVRFQQAIASYKFEELVESITVNPEYERLVEWSDPSHTMYELDKQLLKRVSNDQTMSNECRKFAETLVQLSDPNLDFVRVELF